MGMCYELREMRDNRKLDADKMNQAVDNFLGYMMKNFETELVIMGSKIAIKQFNVKFNPVKLKHYDEFHKKFGKYVLDAMKV
jgi:hypothetical protein